MAKRRAKGEGSIWYDEKRSRWMAQITLPNGKRRGKSGSTQKEVLDWLTEQRQAVKNETYVLDEKITFGAFLKRYMTDVAEVNLRPNTVRGHWTLINHHIEPELGGIRLNHLRPHHLQAFYTKKLKEGLSRRYVQYGHAIIRKALGQALKWGLVHRNVATLVDAPTPKKKAPTVWSAEQTKEFLDAVSDHMWYPIYILACYTGMRQGEILAIHKEDVDLKKGTIHVNHTLSYIPGEGMKISRPKTEAASRPVTLPVTARKALAKHLEQVDKGLIFTTRSGKPISARNVVRHFKSVIEEVGLPEIRFHDLRHTHATLLLKANVHPSIVQNRLGHSQIGITLDTYSHVIPSMQEEAAEKVEDILS